MIAEPVVYPGPPRGLFRLLWAPCERSRIVDRVTTPLWWARFQVWVWLYDHNFAWGWYQPHPGVFVPYDEEAIERLDAETRAAVEINTAYYLEEVTRERAIEG